MESGAVPSVAIADTPVAADDAVRAGGPPVGTKVVCPAGGDRGAVDGEHGPAQERWRTCRPAASTRSTVQARPAVVGLHGVDTVVPCTLRAGPAPPRSGHLRGGLAPGRLRSVRRGRPGPVGFAAAPADGACGRRWPRLGTSTSPNSLGAGRSRPRGSRDLGAFGRPHAGALARTTLALDPACARSGRAGAVARGALDMAAQVTLTEPEVRAFSSLLSRVSERLATYEQQTHQDVRHAEELKAAADDLLSRLEQ